MKTEITSLIADRVMDVLKSRNRVRRLHDDKILILQGMHFKRLGKEH